MFLLVPADWRRTLNMAEITIRISDKAIKAVAATLATTLLIWGVAQVWSSGAFLRAYEIKMFTREASGIESGTPVRLDGMPVGRVGRVELTGDSTDPNRRFLVVLRIEKRSKELIRSDSTASFLTQGLLGERFVNIQRGFSGSPLDAGAEIRVPPTKEIGAMDFLNAIERSAKCGDTEKGTASSKPQVDLGKPASQK